jgi:hypothetical protein
MVYRTWRFNAAFTIIYIFFNVGLKYGSQKYKIIQYILMNSETHEIKYILAFSKRKYI